VAKVIKINMENSASKDPSSFKENLAVNQQTSAPKVTRSRSYTKQNSVNNNSSRDSFSHAEAPLKLQNQTTASAVSSAKLGEASSKTSTSAPSAEIRRVRNLRVLRNKTNV